MDKTRSTIIFIELSVLVAMATALRMDKGNRRLVTCPKIISRFEWKARDALDSNPLVYSPTPYVVVHHSGVDLHCYNQSRCAEIIRSYQDLHIDENHWSDIGYNFIIGEDGNVYEGRGWNLIGAHAPGYNTQSIGVCIIGNFNNNLPDQAALKTLKFLIKCGIGLRKIRKDYFVIGHLQARDTFCPGQMLYEYVQSLTHWTDKPVPIYNNQTTTTTIQY